MSSNKKTSKRPDNLFTPNVLQREIRLNFSIIGQNIRDNLELMLKGELEGMCSKEGYIKKNSIDVLSYSSGMVESNYVVFKVVFSCEVCNPVEGMKIKCKTTNITKAGIRAIYGNEIISPIVIFIARDHQINNNKYYSSVKINDNIYIKVVGIRFELNDDVISVLGELVSPKEKKQKTKTIRRKKKGKIKLTQ
jgi:hypothetical protein